MYKVDNLEWLPKPHVFSFSNSHLKDYKYTSSIVFAIENNRLLLANVKTRGWDFVGGRIDDGESILDCAYREFKEETGYVATKMEFIGCNRIDCDSNPKGSKTAQAIYYTNQFKKVTDSLEDDILEVDSFSRAEINQFNFPEWKVKLISYIFDLHYKKIK